MKQSCIQFCQFSLTHALGSRQQQNLNLINLHEITRVFCMVVWFLNDVLHLHLLHILHLHTLHLITYITYITYLHPITYIT